LQALTTLNEPVFLECARALAWRTVREGGATDVQRLRYAFRRCLARTPTERESSALLTLLDKESQRFAAGKLNPWDLAADKPGKPPELLNPVGEDGRACKPGQLCLDLVSFHRRLGPPLSAGPIEASLCNGWSTCSCRLPAVGRVAQ